MSKGKDMSSAPIVYLEIPAPQIDKAKDFYSSIFGWQITPSDLTDKKYYMFQAGEDGLMGALDATKAPSSEGHIFYIKVDSIEGALEEILKKDGKVKKEKFNIGAEYGCSAIFQDNNGNHVGLWSQS